MDGRVIRSCHPQRQMASALRTGLPSMHRGFVVLVLRLHSMPELAKREETNAVCSEVKDPSLVATGKRRWASQGQ